MKEGPPGLGTELPLKLIIEGKIRGTKRRGRRRKQLLDDLTETRRYWKLKEEAQGRTLWRTQFGRGYRPVARQTTTWLDCSACEALKPVTLKTAIRLVYDVSDERRASIFTFTITICTQQIPTKRQYWSTRTYGLIQEDNNIFLNTAFYSWSLK
jgi:hypothetical protein